MSEPHVFNFFFEHPLDWKQLERSKISNKQSQIVKANVKKDVNTKI